MSRLLDTGISLIKRNEGCKLNAYYDVVGIPTIGFGHTGPEVHIGQTITGEQANDLLIKDLIYFCDGVTELVKVEINDNQFSALVSFAFNLGLGVLKHSTLLQKLNTGDYEGAANEFVKWCHAGGVLNTGLLRRRKEERDLFLTSENV